MSVLQLARYPELVAGEGEFTTVWLLGVLGGNCGGGNGRVGGNVGDGEKKGGGELKKRDILSVSIPAACRIIESNDLDLPLRYVSNLMYGITICYNKKTEFVLNDLKSLLLQLQRKYYYSATGAAGNAGKKSCKVKVNKTIWSANIEQSLLYDDPLYNVNEISSFEKMLGVTNIQSNLIKRQDILNEIVTHDNTEFAHDALNRHDIHGGPDEYIPMDLDFDLIIDNDDIISQHGTSLQKSSDSGNTTPNTKIDLNYNNEFNPQLLNDISNIDLEVQEIEKGMSSETSLEDESFADDLGPACKKLKPNFGPSIIWNRIKHDEKTGMTTDTLRNNFNNYNLEMENYQKKMVNQNKFTKRSHQNIDVLLSDNIQNNFLLNTWKLLLNSDISIRGNVIIETGRNMKRSHSVRSFSTSSSIHSQEQGRKMYVAKDNYALDDNLLLNLDQIDEELNDHFIDHNDIVGDDYMHMNLELPPSSFGRNNTRTSNTAQSIENDMVNVLQSRMLPSRKSNVSNSISNSVISDPNTILDYQTKKFYDYIKERTLLAGKNTHSYKPFDKKILFEDLVPSKITNQNNDNSQQNISVSKKIAASAFLSLLNLASKDIVGLKNYNKNSNTKFQTLNGDDIVVYV